MFRKYIIRNYISGSAPDFIIGHSSSMFIRPTILIILLLFVLYGVYSILYYYMPDSNYIQWICIILGLLLLVKHTIDFLNFYLDCLVLSPTGMTLFMREGIFEYKTDFFERNTIETISHTQNSFRDKLFDKGDLNITINHAIAFPFENVPNPKKMAKLIQQTQEKHGLRIEHEDDDTIAPAADYSVLMEALGEVVQEYVEKKKKKDDYDYEDDY